MQLLRFRVGSDLLALPVERVVQIIDRRPVTRVPDLSAAIAGVFNHGGAITPVVDLAAKFRSERAAGARGCILIVSADHDGGTVAIGLLADAVVDVIAVEAAAIEPPPRFGMHVRLDYLAGLAKTGAEFTLILDVARFLTAEELLDLAAAREAAIDGRQEVYA